MNVRTITIDPAVRRAVAERIVEMACPGYSVQAQGAWFLVDGERLIHRSPTAAWNPWPVGSHAIRVDLLLQDRRQEGVRLHWFDPTPPSGERATDEEIRAAWAGAVSLAEDYLPESIDIEEPEPASAGIWALDTYEYLTDRLGQIDEELADAEGTPQAFVLDGERSGLQDALRVLETSCDRWEIFDMVQQARGDRDAASNAAQYYTGRYRALELAFSRLSREQEEME